MEIRTTLKSNILVKMARRIFTTNASSRKMYNKKETTEDL